MKNIQNESTVFPSCPTVNGVGNLKIISTTAESLKSRIVSPISIHRFLYFVKAGGSAAAGDEGQAASDLREWMSRLAYSASSHVIRNGDLLNGGDMGNLANDFGTNSVSVTYPHIRTKRCMH